MKRILITAVLTFLCVIVTACQPTPPESAVQSKSNGKFEKAIKDTPKEAELEVPDTVECTYSAKTDGVTVEINANPIYENVSMIPIVEVAAQDISTDFIKKAIDACMQGGDIYEPPYKLTKKDISQKLKELEKQMTDDYLAENYPEAIRVSMKEQFEGEYSYYTSAYKDAPEESNTGVKATMEFKPEKYYTDKKELEIAVSEAKKYNDNEAVERLLSDIPSTFKCLSYANDGYILGLTAINYTDEYNQASYIRFQKGTELDPNFGMMPKHIIMTDEMYSCTKTKKDAIKEADALISSLGLSGELAFSSYEKRSMPYDRSCYVLIYRRTSGGLVMDVIPERNSKSEYRRGYEEEYLEIFITDDGIMAWTYYNPLTVTKIVNKGVAIFSFSEILDIFKKQSSLQYDNIMRIEEEYGVEDPDLNEMKAASAVAKITGIELTLMRIAEKDSTLKYLIVPVWKFSGEIRYYDENGEWIGADKDEKLGFTNDATILINAVDGSIISADDCY